MADKDFDFDEDPELIDDLKEDTDDEFNDLEGDDDDDDEDEDDEDGEEDEDL